ncbi:hypothetical protein [Alloactinosynnema sp. L-07]|uniref:hypothetical protein n=1 Tax=Alloactinosynnema sp. L-07 TaxID=1653480 RepID=UPI0012F7B503|nr:hypothetical protein [Alloactinosynnema sp. L-07]
MRAGALIVLLVLHVVGCLSDSMVGPLATSRPVAVVAADASRLDGGDLGRTVGEVRVGVPARTDAHAGCQPSAAVLPENFPAPVAQDGDAPAVQAPWQAHPAMVPLGSAPRSPTGRDVLTRACAWLI